MRTLSFHFALIPFGFLDLLDRASSMRAASLTEQSGQRDAVLPCGAVLNGVARRHHNRSGFDYYNDFDPVAHGAKCKCKIREHRVFCGNQLVENRRYHVNTEKSVFAMKACRDLPIEEQPICRLPPGVERPGLCMRFINKVDSIIDGPEPQGKPVDLKKRFDLSDVGCVEAMQPYKDMLTELGRRKNILGGVRTYKGREPIRIVSKELRKKLNGQLTQYEYVYLQILGFACAQANAGEIAGLNNGQDIRHNYGSQLLDARCGLVWHGHHLQSDHLLTAAAELLVNTFERVNAADNEGDRLTQFFQLAFDPNFDPCLEGRVRFLQTYSNTLDGDFGGPAPDDLVLQSFKKDATTMDIVGEYLRVFHNECVRSWALQKNMTFQEAKAAKDATEENRNSFEWYYNEEVFRQFIEPDHPVEQAELDMAIKSYVEELMTLPEKPEGATAFKLRV
eukprot:TRINITY_DN10875_c0_g1_i1.p1 TRINITY_DN10875_c0_g1~~TRINITY_DN10875_c0_g1_i1.p1  ORF type:complete len:465 (-),score=48.28 TRINITY_DN10875_c0_g1_i1:12-1358(-)